MSFKAVFEVFLHVHDFANVDLPCQGVFRLRASLYQEEGTQKIYATPFEFMEDRKKPVANSKKIQQSCSVEPPYFYSKAGIIKYSDEKVVFDDQIRFKLEVESFPRLHSEQVYIEFELLFSEFCYSSSSVPDFEGSVVGTKKFRLEGMELGILNYCEGEFPGSYPSRFSFTLYACLSNFKFGKYKLAGEMEALGKEDGEGRIKVQSGKANEGIRAKELQRSRVKSFEELLVWVDKYYKDKVGSPLSYFYNTYAKNLRYYFYLAQEKLNSNSIIKHSKVLKVPKEFLELPSGKGLQKETEVTEKEFRKYMTNYEPKKLSPDGILQEINTIYTDIYMYLMGVEKEFQLDQLMHIKMKAEFATYVKERYGERVFRSVNRTNEMTACSSSRENKRIAKKMREKEATTSTVSYPIEDVSFLEGKEMMEFLFYEITNPKTVMHSKEKSETRKEPVQISQKTLENIFGKVEKQEKVEKINSSSILTEFQKEERKPQLKQESHSEEESKIIDGQDQVNSKSEENDDIYGSVIHEKGSVDSELTEKSFEKKSHSSNDQEGEGFEGISEVSCKGKQTWQIKKAQAKVELPQLDYDEKNMLVVMCHGFQGSSYDMSILLRGLKELLPNATYLVARSNEGYTEGDIDDMGKRLHDEVENYIKNYMEKDTVILNFVGHSMGGIVARAGVKYLMKKYSNQLGFFCSLSSPHLGYLNGVDGMIKAGLWAIMKFKPIKSLQQLKMEDEKDLRNTFLYRLASEGSLRRFRKVILFSSFEDSYVSWHSARVSVHQGKNKKLMSVEEEMVSEMLGEQPIHRVDVNFNVRTKNLDSFIGRTAHINLIVQQSLFKIINSTIPELFDLRQ